MRTSDWFNRNRDQSARTKFFKHTVESTSEPNQTWSRSRPEIYHRSMACGQASLYFTMLAVWPMHLSHNRYKQRCKMTDSFPRPGHFSQFSWNESTMLSFFDTSLHIRTFCRSLVRVRIHGSGQFPMLYFLFSFVFLGWIFLVGQTMVNSQIRGLSSLLAYSRYELWALSSWDSHTRSSGPIAFASCLGASDHFVMVVQASPADLEANWKARRQFCRASDDKYDCSRYSGAAFLVSGKPMPGIILQADLDWNADTLGGIPLWITRITREWSTDSFLVWSSWTLNTRSRTPDGGSFQNNYKENHR
jgi:hypothetical protein